MLRIWVGLGGAVNTQKTEGFRAVKKKIYHTDGFIIISLHVIIHLLKAIECTAPGMSPM